ncbi:unnamed protein product [Lupinus luteus]|uniref:Uncharacterized protein n=1 Tax=Lupinus luteus TaxID=3873 RepID=A0AAV1XPJ9_LUPLU
MKSGIHLKFDSLFSLINLSLTFSPSPFSFDTWRCQWRIRAPAITRSSVTLDLHGYR